VRPPARRAPLDRHRETTVEPIKKSWQIGLLPC
jgi:hypothetical protein